MVRLKSKILVQVEGAPVSGERAASLPPFHRSKQRTNLSSQVRYSTKMKSSVAPAPTLLSTNRNHFLAAGEGKSGLVSESDKTIKVANQVYKNYVLCYNETLDDTYCKKCPK
jgi:hypothetical protein